MSDTENLFHRRILPEVGLSIDFCPEPTVESTEIEGGRNIYQRLAANDALIFLRYGKNETLENFISSPADLMTTVSPIDDRAVSYCGEPARQVRLLVTRQSLREYRHEQGSLVHIDHPKERTIIFVIGFSRSGIPVLVGYRVPEARLEQSRPLLERFVQSVSCL
jgi:hypothetical protein